MRFLFSFFICLLLYNTDSMAIGRRHRYMGPPRNEAELMERVLGCLSTKDSISYYNMFPPLDTFWRMVIHNADQSPDAVRQLNVLREHPTIFIDLDPYYNHGIMTRFREVLAKGEDSGINWQGIVMQRYELQKQEVAPGMEGMRLIAPERFMGYLFVRDMLSSTTFCITITEIQKVRGAFCGGQVLNVLEANTIDQFMAKEAAERKAKLKMQQLEKQRLADSIKRGAELASHPPDSTAQNKDSAKTIAAKADTGPKLPVDSAKLKKSLLLSVPGTTEDDKNKMRWEVVDRKLYKGLFDEEMSVELYVRYMKDANGKVTNWDGLYKFGDMQEYIKLEISKSEDGKWIMEEPSAVMELELNQKVYTGAWTNGENQTGYDVELTQKDLSQAKMMKLDRILENNAGGSMRNQIIVENKPADSTAAGGKDTTAYKDPLTPPPPKEEDKPRKRHKKKTDEDKTDEPDKTRKKDEDDQQSDNQ